MSSPRPIPKILASMVVNFGNIDTNNKNDHTKIQNMKGGEDIFPSLNFLIVIMIPMIAIKTQLHIS